MWILNGKILYIKYYKLMYNDDSLIVRISNIKILNIKISNIELLDCKARLLMYQIMKYKLQILNSNINYFYLKSMFWLYLFAKIVCVVLFLFFWWFVSG